jgi:glycogen synthase kinase 3 beta
MSDENSSHRQSSHTYTPLKPIGNGAFGMVYKAKDNNNGKIVAIKKVFQDLRYKNRELSILKEINHENCCYLYDYFYTNASDNPDEEYLNLIMEYIPQTLHRELRIYSKQKKSMPLLLIKLYSYQIIRGLAYMHALGICHRDIKPDNILTDPETHELKICDFGSAKKLVKGQPNVSYISSRAYRAPELIFGATEYTTAIDLWSGGCVIAEMVLQTAIFSGESSLEQIVEIIKVLGTPNKSQIQAMNPEYKEYRFPIIKPESWDKVFKGKNMGKDFYDLIDKMLLFSPEKRTKPIYLLGHPFFDELRNKNTKLENGRNLPDLFNFNKTEMKIDPKFIKEKLIPDWYEKNKNHGNQQNNNKHNEYSIEDYENQSND